MAGMMGFFSPDGVLSACFLKLFSVCVDRVEKFHGAHGYDNVDAVSLYVPLIKCRNHNNMSMFHPCQRLAKEENSTLFLPTEVWAATGEAFLACSQAILFWKFYKVAHASLHRRRSHLHVHNVDLLL
jgi:hypothetical protein